MCPLHFSKKRRTSWRLKKPNSVSELEVYPSTSAIMASEGDCPVCFEDQLEPMITPCICGFEICFWCWHTISTVGRRMRAIPIACHLFLISCPLLHKPLPQERNGLCPSCRAPYGESPTAGNFTAAKRAKSAAASGESAVSSPRSTPLPYPPKKKRILVTGVASKTLEIVRPTRGRKGRLFWAASLSLVSLFPPIRCSIY